MKTGGRQEGRNMEAAAGGGRGKIGRKNIEQKKTELQERHRMKNKTDKRKSGENFVASILSSIMNVSRLDKNFSSYSSLQNVNKQRPSFFSHLPGNLPVFPCSPEALTNGRRWKLQPVSHNSILLDAGHSRLPAAS